MMAAGYINKKKTTVGTWFALLICQLAHMVASPI